MEDYQLDDLSRRYTKVDYAPTDISRHGTGNTGVDHVWSFEADAPGPSTVIIGAMHGNEIAGAAILDRLLGEEIRPDFGRLTLVLGNPAAYARFDATRPYLNRFLDVDINRVWGSELSDPADTRAEVRRARALQPVFEGADFLLDLHTMQGNGEPVALITDKPETMAFVSAMSTLPFVLSGRMHQPDRVRLRDHGRFGDPAAAAVAIQVEAGQHWQREAIGTGLAVVEDFLSCAGATVHRPISAGARQRRLRLVETVMTGDRFEFAEDFRSGTHFPRKGTLVGYSGHDSAEVRTPVDDCYLIMPVHFRLPGGSCCRFAVESA